MGVTIPGPSGEVLEQYEVSNSLRFNDDDDARLTRSVSGNLSKAHTFALWIKRGNLKASGRHILAAMGDGSGDISWLELNNDRLAVIFDGGGNYFPKTDAVLRDPSAWYHIVVAVDSTESTAADRCKFYINGVQFTDTSGTFPPLNHQAAMDACTIGYNSGDEFDGYMTEFHFLDGVAYDPTYFGRFNENNVWVPKKYTGGNYGTNGFYFEFKQTGTSQNSSGIGADTSGNDNHFAVTNLAATDVTEDTCTNNFATLNPLQARATYGMPTLAEGNLQFGGSGHSSSWGYRGSTIEVSSGKWYCEVKCSGNSYAVIGVFNTGYYGESHFLDQNPQNNTGSWGIYHDGATNTQKILNGSASSASVAEFNDDDIVGMELDADNQTIKFYVNGSLQTDLGSSGTVDISAGTGDAFIFVALTSNGAATTFNFNFGNPPFSISSGNTDGKYGNFEYAPSSGFYALCTKRLAEFG